MVQTHAVLISWILAAFSWLLSSTPIHSRIWSASIPFLIVFSFCGASQALQSFSSPSGVWIFTPLSSCWVLVRCLLSFSCWSLLFEGCFQLLFLNQRWVLVGHEHHHHFGYGVRRLQTVSQRLSKFTLFPYSLS
jgi:hypothetical protein